MFQSLTSKVISGIVSLSMLLLSSYEGNIAEFSNIEAQFLSNRILLKTQLLNAFENDFEEIFKSGQTIEIFFEITIKDNSEVIHTNEFKHTVIFDPMEQFYTLNLEEQDSETNVYSHEDLKTKISEIEYLFESDVKIPDELQVTFTSYLKKMRLETLGEEYDMMMLWKFKKPKIKQTISKPEYEI